ncbi:MAG TPA: ABC transporter permease, partial [Rhodothermales bacterium]|nr:ABC transporter permease [Rhodothermales bacterium]
FNDLAAKDIAFSTLLSPGYIFGLIGIALVVGLLAGSYPAFLLSSFPSIDVLKGTFKSTSRGVVLRKGLVVFQFAISVAMIAATAIVFDQLAYMRNQDLGFDKEQVVVIDGQGLPGSVVAQQFETAKEEFEWLPGVQQVATSTVVPGRGNWLQIYTAEGLAENDSRRAQIIVIDDDYLDTYQIEMVAGRGFSEEFESDQQTGILLNETAVENIGWASPEYALGKTIDLDTTRTVIGVVKDYHHASLKQTLEPMLFVELPQFFRYFSIRLSSDDLPATMASLEETWNTLFPAYTFESFFLDEDFDNQYRTEQQLTKVFGTFAFLAVLIACLGLFGLAAFTAQQRTKEIGVRKVLGASVPSIVLLLSKEFTYLVLTSVVLAAPVAYFAMDQWLEAFPYRVPISIWVFVGGGLAALLIAWLTVSYQAIKAALTDPVNSLRYE